MLTTALFLLSRLPMTHSRLHFYCRGCHAFGAMPCVFCRRAYHPECLRSLPHRRRWRKDYICSDECWRGHAVLRHVDSTFLHIDFLEEEKLPAIPDMHGRVHEDPRPEPMVTIRGESFPLFPVIKDEPKDQEEIEDDDVYIDMTPFLLNHAQVEAIHMRRAGHDVPIPDAASSSSSYFLIIETSEEIRNLIALS